jgi:hypothetical protein
MPIQGSRAAASLKLPNPSGILRSGHSPDVNPARRTLYTSPPGAMRTLQPRTGLPASFLLPAIEPLKPGTRRALESFEAYLVLSQQIVGKRAPGRLIQTLMDVGWNPDTTRTELAGRVGMPLTTASQDLRTLSTERRDGSPGLGLVEARWDAMDVRLLRYRCTPRGEMALARLNAAVEEGTFN